MQLAFHPSFLLLYKGESNETLKYVYIILIALLRFSFDCLSYVGYSSLPLLSIRKLNLHFLRFGFLKSVNVKTIFLRHPTSCIGFTKIPRNPLCNQVYSYAEDVGCCCC